MPRSRPLTRVAVAGTLLATLAACTSGSSGDNDTSKPLPKITGNPPVTLNVFAPQAADQNLKTNKFTQLIKQKFNITINWQTTTQDGGPAKEKRQISLASGDLPDLYLLIPWVDQFSQTELLKLSTQGVIQPLNQLIDQYGPNIKKAFADVPAYKRMATAPDGKIYGLPQWVDCFHCSYPAKLWMNGAWLKKLGLKPPTTTDEFRDVLSAFKTKDPNGNGKADEVPLSGDTGDTIIPYLMNAFIDTPTGNSAPDTNPTLVLNDGKADIQANKEGWREGLRYIKSLYDEGLIDSSVFTQNAEALMKLGDHAGGVILGSATVMHPQIAVTGGQKDGRDLQYDALPPLTGPEGKSYATLASSSVPGATFVLTTKASQTKQIQAIKMLNYIFSEEGELNGMFGPEGPGWARPGPKDIALDDSVKARYKRGTAPANGNWGALTQYNNTAQFRNTQAVAKDPKTVDGWERRLFEATKLYEGHESKSSTAFPYGEAWIDPSRAGELATLQTNIGTFVQQSAVQFITGKKSLDSDWDSYLKNLDQLGLKRFLQIYQQAYDKTH
ncbi:extracellular solute-binding protein [Streptomyces montanus]|uniref:Extracellular solute-binding protein n=1 Tax=Streptomyces montanus TaxID=2580423 RepID=A0A5R9FTS9_9ACTN|nr:extracellular solute-binding protein [Streptomyces montanus]TLS44293.1 extracellular solute-binding protein [Streptomyces montanus]